MRRYEFECGFLFWLLLLPGVAILAAQLFPLFEWLRGH